MPFVVREYAHHRDPSLGAIRSDFTETVYWHPVLVLPDSGRTKVEFQLSDDIARYQVLVAGHTIDGRIGAITKTIEARKPFTVDPKLPLEITQHRCHRCADPRHQRQRRSPGRLAFTLTPSKMSVEGGGLKTSRGPVQGHDRPGAERQGPQGFPPEGRRNCRATQRWRSSATATRPPSPTPSAAWSTSCPTASRSSARSATCSRSERPAASRCRRTWYPARSRCASKSTRRRWPIW